MRKGKFGNVSLRDVISDAITEALPYNTDEEKAFVDDFTKDRAFDRMLDNILNEVDEHITYNMDILSEEVTK